MSVAGLSSETACPTDKSAPRADLDTPSAHPSYAPLRDRLLAAARVAEKATDQHLGDPIRVDVTEQGCTAIMDTAGLLAWAVLFDARPRIEPSDVNPRFILVRGYIDGTPWTLHNAVSAVEESDPADEPARGETAAEVPEGETLVVPVPHPRRAPRRD